MKGKAVLVSGGTTGIGRAIVELFLAQGARVATFARSADDVATLQKDFPEAKTFVADLTDRDALRQVVDETVAAFGGIDVLVNNAGVAGESITSMEFDEWKTVLDVNLAGPMLLTSLVAERLEPGAHIVTVGSMSAKVREEGSDVYVAAKSGLRGFVDSLSRILNRRGILLTLVEPGLTEADMTSGDEGEAEIRQKKEAHEMMDSVDVARAVLFAATQPAHMVIPFLQVRPRMQLI